MISSQETPKSGPVPRLLRPYLCACGLGLLVSALGALILRLAEIEPPLWLAGFSVDSLHATVHIVWGLILLVPLARRAADLTLARLAITFGTFYLVLAVLGVVVHDPLGMRLGWGEQAFHFIIGPLTLLLGIIAWRATQTRSLTASA